MNQVDPRGVSKADKPVTVLDRLGHNESRLGMLAEQQATLQQELRQLYQVMGLPYPGDQTEPAPF